MNSSPEKQILNSNRCFSFLLFVFCIITFGYFYQGGGWNQNAHFSTVRSIADNYSLDISAYPRATGDLSQTGDKLYSNKTPGLAFLAAPFYKLFRSISDFSENTISYLLTIIFSGVPVFIIALLIFKILLLEGFSLTKSSMITIAFACGTLLFPYSGVLMSHTLVAALLFSSWYLLIYTESSEGWSGCIGGICIAYACFCEYLIIPLTVFWCFYKIIVNLRDRNFSLSAYSSLLGPVLYVILAGLFQYVIYGGIFYTSYAHQAALFEKEGLWLGMFEWPRISRLYFLTLHPYKGLFVYCPVLFLSLIALLTTPLRKWLSLKDLSAWLVVSYFFVVISMFDSWPGGWGFGSRYLIPAIPFMFFLGLKTWQKTPLFSTAIAIVSIIIMFIITSVGLMIPASNSGVPLPETNPLGRPLRWAFSWFFNGQLSISTQSITEYYPSERFAQVSETAPGNASDYFDSFNLGELMGLNGVYSLVPLIAVQLVIVIVVCKLGNRRLS